jgi:hypothetical protein
LAPGRRRCTILSSEIPCSAMRVAIAAAAPGAGRTPAAGYYALKHLHRRGTRGTQRKDPDLKPLPRERKAYPRLTPPSALAAPRRNNRRSARATLRPA